MVGFNLACTLTLPTSFDLLDDILSSGTFQCKFTSGLYISVVRLREGRFLTKIWISEIGCSTTLTYHVSDSAHVLLILISLLVYCIGPRRGSAYRPASRSRSDRGSARAARVRMGQDTVIADPPLGFGILEATGIFLAASRHRAPY